MAELFNHVESSSRNPNGKCHVTDHKISTRGQKYLSLRKEFYQPIFNARSGLVENIRKSSVPFRFGITALAVGTVNF